MGSRAIEATRPGSRAMNRLPAPAQLGFKTEGDAYGFAWHYLLPGEPLDGMHVARAARRLADSDPVTAARLELAHGVILQGVKYERGML